MSFDNIPNDLKATPNWVIWRFERLENGRVTKVPYSPVTGRLASSTNPADWGSWFTANAALAASGYDGLGFVFSVNDPFCGIDLDDPYAINPDGTSKFTPEQQAEVIALQQQVYQTFAHSYAEYSPSGKGLHIIVKAEIPEGKRKGGIEVYSSGRFFTMTGNVHRNLPVAEAQAQVQWLWQVLGGGSKVAVFEGTEEDTEPDQTIYERGINAVNGQAFLDLWNGNWQEKYSSQSEADFALIDMLAFYTPSRPQIKRMFLMSGLGQREKARVRDGSYVEPMITKAFDRHPPPLDVADVRAKIEAQFADKFSSGMPVSAVAGNVPPPVKGPSPYLRDVPGLLGQIAYFIYEASPRPVPEVALAAALGLMAGICGRAWNVSGTGLNMYIMLLAGTGRGKEAMHTGVSRLMQQVASVGPGGGGCPGAMEFIGPDDIASGQALNKYMSKTSKSFVTVQGEFDVTLKSFTARNANAALLKLKQFILKSYARSGRGMQFNPTIYSDAEKNTHTILSPAFTLVGEGTPQRFYSLLDESLVEDGLLPRFTIVHYDGVRVNLNKAHRNAEPSHHLVKNLAALCGQSLMLNQSNNAIDVQMTPDAEAFFDGYERDTTNLINETGNDTLEQIWNRAHLKAMKIAALVAVGINSSQPVITLEAAQYAIDIVNYDTKRLVSKFESGNVGDSESRQVATLRRMIRRYVQADPSNAHKMGSTAQMIADKIVPKRFLQQRTVNAAPFKNDRLGATNALNRTILALVEAGVLQQLGPIETRKYGAQGAKLFAVIDASWLAKGAEDDD
jgi:hypothetical protein